MRPNWSRESWSRYSGPTKKAQDAQEASSKGRETMSDKREPYFTSPLTKRSPEQERNAHEKCGCPTCIEWLAKNASGAAPQPPPFDTLVHQALATITAMTWEHHTTNESYMTGFREAKDKAIDVLRAALAAPATEKLREALDALYKDSHRWSTRPCKTCDAVSTAVGFPFGCDRLAGRALTQQQSISLASQHSGQED